MDPYFTSSASSAMTTPAYYAAPHPDQTTTTTTTTTTPSAAAEWNVLLDEMSTQMAGSDLTRRRSSRRQGPWSNLANRDPARSTRVGKAVTSTGSSPLSSSIKRRTSTSGASIRWTTPAGRARPESSVASRFVREQAGTHTDAIRPISWHPSSSSSSAAQTTSAAGHPPWPLSNAARSLETTAMMTTTATTTPWVPGGPYYGVNPYLNEPATPSLYPCSENMSPVIQYSPLTTAFDDRDSRGFYGPDLMGPSPGNYFTLPYASLENAKLPASLAAPPPSLLPPYYDGLTSVPYASDVSPLSFYPLASSPTLEDDFLPIQQPDLSGGDVTGQGEPDPGSSSRPSDRPEPELVGMGLYDDVCSASAESGAKGGRKARTGRKAFDDDGRPCGKGLKLEETWTPPGENGGSGKTDGRTTKRKGAASGAPKAAPEVTLGPLLESSFLLDDGCLFDDSYGSSTGMTLHPASLTTCFN